MPTASSPFASLRRIVVLALTLSSLASTVACGGDGGGDSQWTGGNGPGGAPGTGGSGAGGSSDTGGSGAGGSGAGGSSDTGGSGPGGSPSTGGSGLGGGPGTTDACADDNGGCDPLSSCTDTAEGPSCGACPSGYVGTGAEGCTPLLLDLTLSAGTLSPAVSPEVTEHAAQIALGSQTLDLTPSVPEGATVSIDGAAVAAGEPWTSPTLDLGDNTFEIVVGQSGHPSRTYTLTVTRGSQQAYVKASNTGAGDELGSAVALSADGTTLAVAAPSEDSNATTIGGNQSNDAATNAGAVYVFTRTGSAWAQQAYIKASNGEPGDQFGWSVALSGDGNTLAVGAYLEDSDDSGVGADEDSNLGPGAGAVYVFTRTGSAWAQQAYVKASNVGIMDAFGWSVALSGDGDTLAVGAVAEASNATDVGGDQTNDSAASAGAVYVFTRAGGVWTQQAYLKASNTGGGDEFGYAVALSGDGDTLAVGAVGEDSNATGVGGVQTNGSASGSGAVYVFTRTGSAWAQQAYVKASNTGLGDRFGSAVALSSGGDTLAVGAPYEDSGAPGDDEDPSDDSASNAGAAYVFTRTGSAWSQQAYVKASNPGSQDDFGMAVALSGNGGTLAVGAIGEASSATGLGGDQADDSAFGAGAAYVFTRAGSAWSQRGYVKASHPDADDQFGFALALSADGTTLATGAYNEASNATGIDEDPTDDSAPSAGAVYVFR